MAGSAEAGKVGGVEEATASSAGLDLVDVGRGGAVAAFADGSVGEEFADEWDALLPVEAGSLLGSGPEAGPSLERLGSAHGSRVGQGSRGGTGGGGGGMGAPPGGLVTYRDARR